MTDKSAERAVELQDKEAREEREEIIVRAPDAYHYEPAVSGDNPNDMYCYKPAK